MNIFSDDIYSAGVFSDDIFSDCYIERPTYLSMCIFSDNDSCSDTLRSRAKKRLCLYVHILTNLKLLYCPNNVVLGVETGLLSLI